MKLIQEVAKLMDDLEGECDVCGYQGHLTLVGTKPKDVLDLFAGALEDKGFAAAASWVRDEAFILVEL